MSKKSAKPGFCQEDEEDFSAKLQRQKDVCLVEYAAKGHVGCVKAAIEAGAGVNAEVVFRDDEPDCFFAFQPDEDNYDNFTTALMEAARNGHVECIEELIKSGANVNYEHGYGWTALMTAAENGELECVKVLIKAGTQLNVGNAQTCMGALQYAAKGGHTECLKELIAAGADVNNPDDTSALAYAAGEGHVECVKLLLEAGADDRDEALARAEEAGHDECVKVLKSKQRKKAKKQ